MTEKKELITALYARLSVDDGYDGESNSISNQKEILLKYAKDHGFHNMQFFVDDGISGTTFDRPDFLRMNAMIERGEIGTVIVKDLSRFGRNYLEAGNYLEMKYPSLNVRFIAIQENVDTMQGTGTEMMPFNNIFNEWYAAQTSKKIRAVWQSKAAKGERVSAVVPYGYKKESKDSKQWVIDEPAAAIVRYIFSLFLDGISIHYISLRLEKEKVLNPTAYQLSIGLKVRNKLPANQYSWNPGTIRHILDNRQYTGCTVNFISTEVSYKVHKRVFHSQDEWQIIPNTQEAIIDEDTFNRVQELRKHKHRYASSGRTSLFSGLVFCGDCGSKMYFGSAQSMKPNQDFFRCSQYKENRGSCKIHYIRNNALEQIVFATIKQAADFISQYEDVFLYKYNKEHELASAKQFAACKHRMATTKNRVQELDRLIARVYEDNVLGRLSDERYLTMTKDFETEQRELKEQLKKDTETFEKAGKGKADLSVFLTAIRKCIDITELNATMVNTLIQKIEVFNPEIIDGEKHVPVKIHFTAVGVLDLPDEQEVLRIMQEIKQNSKQPA